MPVLHTRLENSFGVSRDEQGRDYPSVDEAVKQAGITASQVLQDDLVTGHPIVNVKVHIERPDGATVAMVTVDAVVTRFEDNQTGGSA